MRHEKNTYLPMIQATSHVLSLSWLLYPAMDLYAIIQPNGKEYILDSLYITSDIFTLFIPIICIFISAYLKSKPLIHTQS